MEKQILWIEYLEFRSDLLAALGTTRGSLHWVEDDCRRAQLSRVMDESYEFTKLMGGGGIDDKNLIDYSQW